MNNNIYQEYINNMLGTMPRNEMGMTDSQFMQFNPYNNLQEKTYMEIEQYYPDLYKLLYPMIQAACMRNTKPITKETIDEMVNEIYSNFNDENLSILNSVPSSDTNSSKVEKNTNTKTTKTQSETRQIRRPNNYVINDLIRILLIRELLRRPGNFPPNRPGFPTSRPDGRPPFRPRNMQNIDYSIYEEPINLYSSYNNYKML